MVESNGDVEEVLAVPSQRVLGTLSAPSGKPETSPKVTSFAEVKDAVV